MKKSLTILTTGETAMHKLGAQIPDGTVLGARGPFGPYAPNNALQQVVPRRASRRSSRRQPNYASYQMAQAILGVKLAWEKAQDAERRQAPEQRAGRRGAREHDLRRTRRHGAHGDRQGPPGDHGDGLRRRPSSRTASSRVVNVKRYPAEKVNPPEGVKSADWIKSGFKK